MPCPPEQHAEQLLVGNHDVLRATTERLRLALSAGRLGDWSWAAATDVVSLGNGAAQIFGVDDANELTLRALRALLHREDRRRVRIAVETALAKHHDCTVEFRLQRDGAESRWVLAHGLGTYSDTGAVQGMTGVIQDITERRNTEDALQRNQARLQMAVEAGQMGDWEWNVATGKVHWSAALESVHGMSEGSFGGGFDDFQRDIHPDDRARVLATIKSCVDTTSQYRVEYRIIKPDGTMAWIEARGKWTIDVRGRPTRMTGICMDVTQRKQAEEALRDETETLELLNRTGTLLASRLELHAIAQVMTDAAAAHTGAQLSAFVFTDAADQDATYFTGIGARQDKLEDFGQFVANELFASTLNTASTECHDDVSKTLANGVQPRHSTTDNAPSPPNIRSYLAAPVISRTGEVIAGIFLGHGNPGMFCARSQRAVAGMVAQAAIAIDNARLYEVARKAAAERQHLLDSERAARSEAERMCALKDDFLATLSHELRTPLSAILGWSRILRNRSAGDAETQRGLETIERNARVQTRLIEDLLDMSRISSGKVRMDVEAVAPAHFIKAAIETLRPVAHAKHIRLAVVLDPSAGPILGDPGRLQQVVWNLLSNSIKFTPKEGSIQVILKQVESQIEISITDSGVGIEADFLPHLFERFRQADASTTRNYGGLGLGLSIVRSLVELHGGTVFATSEGEDRGATFTLRFPLLPAHANAAGDARIGRDSGIDAPHFNTIDLSGLRILVVDDQADARDLVKRLLTDCGADVLTAGDATEALRIIREERPTILVSDIGMPDVDGFELLQRIRGVEGGSDAKLRAIALTAFARSEDRARALRAGFSAHVSKPVEPAHLIATIAMVAGRTAIAETAVEILSG